jgi:tetratricopeptide (TPR) repeat protein
VTDAPKDGENELVLDWDDAVESFRLDLEGSARAESAPFPQRLRADAAPASLFDEPELGPEPSPAEEPAPKPSTPGLGGYPSGPGFGALPSRESDNERPTLPPRSGSPLEDSDAHDLSLLESAFESAFPSAATETRVSSLPPRAGSTPHAVSTISTSTMSTSPPAAPSPASFGRTLSGLAPVAARGPSPTGGGLFVQQRFTPRPENVPTMPPPAQPAPSEQEPTRPTASEALLREARPHMYQPALPSESLFSFDEDDDSDATQVATVPRELLEALLAGSANVQSRNNRVTERPPPTFLRELGSEPEITTLGEASDSEAPEDGDTELSELEDLLIDKLEEQPAPNTSTRPLPPPSAMLSQRPAGLPPAPPQIVTRGSLPMPPRASNPPEVPAATDAVLTDLDELLPPVALPSEKPSPAPKPARPDHGAKAAQHMASASKTRLDAGPLSSFDDSGKRARIGLIEALARGKEGRARALLLVSAAELSEELNDSDSAKERYLRAHEAAPKLLSPIWALARFAFEARNIDDHITWLERASNAAEAPRTRAAALAASARVHWLVQRDLPAALRAATEAARLCPRDMGHRLLELRITLATRADHADPGLMQLAEELGEEPLAPALALFSGRVREARGDQAGASQAYRSASARAANVAEPQLALARMARANGEHEAAGDALRAVAAALGDGVLANAVRRHAAVLLATLPWRRAEALSLLAEPVDVASARTAFAIASDALAAPEAATEELSAALHASRMAWIQHADGHDRALAWVTEARARMQTGHHPEAAQALEEALSFDRTLGLARVLWEILARESGDLSGYLRRTAGEDQRGVLRAAAKLACERSAAPAEAELLAQIGGERELAVARTLRLDARAEAGQLEALIAELEPLSHEPGAPAALFLALADVLRRARGEEAAQELLKRAADLYPDEPLITRAWARNADATPDVVRALLLEAGGARGARAAFLQLLTGQLSTEPARRLEAFERAYEALPSYTPAVFALHSETRRQNELTRLANLHTRESVRAKDPFEVVAHLIRAALVRAHDDGDAAAAQLTRALDLAPADPVLRELVIRLGDAVPATLRAEAMQRIAERASPPFDRSAALAAAGAFEDAGQAERALVLYESVLRSHPEDPISEMGRERVARAAGRTRELLEAKRRAIHEASTDARRVRALEDLLQADNDAPAEEGLDRARALLVLSPVHPLALRRAERVAMERNDLDGLMDTEQRILNSSGGAKDKLARLRLLSLLTSLKRSERARADDLDRVFVAHAAAAHGGPWLSRQLMGAGVALADPGVVLAALDLFASETHEPVELVSLAVRRAQLELADPPFDREAKLSQSLAAYPDHPTGLEIQAELAAARADSTAAAALFAQAAERALHPSRVARLWARAGKLHQDDKRLDQAKAAYTKAVEADVAFEDVEAKLRTLFDAESDVSGMIKLLSARLAKGVPGEQGVKLRTHLSQLHERSGNAEQALASMREALELAPEDLTILRELVRLLGPQKDQRERAQVLLRIARLSREPLELRDVFMRLGEIYDGELPDAKRAEAAYQRALKLGPRHTPALERLAALYTREGDSAQAETCLSKLVELAETPQKRLAAVLELSRAQEDRGDPRAAEETLDTLRRERPVDGEVLRALADFYRRQGALSALAMHLNRATSDLRSVIGAEPMRSAEWLSLMQVLEDKHRPDAARVVAAAARACGVKHERLGPLLDTEGDVPGVASAAFSELLDDLVFGDDMPPSTRIVFRHGAEALNKSVPLDLRAVGGERLERRHPLRAVVNEVARWAGLGDVEVFTSAQLKLAFVPVSDSPPQLLVGQGLLDSLSKKEQVFLSARALKIARAHMSITCRVRPDEMGLLLHGLIRSQLPGYLPEGIDAAGVEEMARRVGKHLNKKVLPELTPHLMELMGVTDFDPARVYAVASTAGNRAGLLATGSPAAALSALAKLAGLSGAGFDRELLDQVEEARDLLSFAIGEAHFEARLRAGVDLR